MSDPTQDQNVMLINQALAISAIQRARKVINRFEVEHRADGLTCSIYPSLDCDFVLSVEDSEGDPIGDDVVECLYNESGSRWLARLRAIVQEHAYGLDRFPPSDN